MVTETLADQHCGPLRVLAMWIIRVVDCLLLVAAGVVEAPGNPLEVARNMSLARIDGGQTWSKVALVLGSCKGVTHEDAAMFVAPHHLLLFCEVVAVVEELVH